MNPPSLVRPSARSRWLSKIAAVVAPLLALFSNAAADTHTVTVASDNPLTPEPGSLRHAITTAEPGDTIQFAPLLAGPITLGGAELVIDKSLTISGPGSANLAIDGNQKSRIFRIPNGVTAIISGLTLRGGRAPNIPTTTTPTPPQAEHSGGAILNAGDTTLTDCIILGNVAGTGGNGNLIDGDGGDGGGIANLGSLIIQSCVIASNSAGEGGSNGGYGGNGGGISQLSGTLSIVESTIRGNIGGKGSIKAGGNGGGIAIRGGSAQIQLSTICQNKAGFGAGAGVIQYSGGVGGGIQTASGSTVEIQNSTISANICGESEVSQSAFEGSGWARKPSSGAGIYAHGTVSITSSTIYGNRGSTSATFTGDFATGTGLYVGAGTTTLSNCIIAKNLSGTSGFQDLAGPVISTGFNLIGVFDPARASGITPGANGDIAGIQASPLDPKVGGLTDFGTPTAIHPLLSGSPAIDTGDDRIAGTDQRGTPRPVGPHADIGAFEGVGTIPASTIAFQSATTNVTETSVATNLVIVRTGDTSTPATVQCVAMPVSTALAGSDFIYSPLVTFAAGQTQATVAINIVNDVIAELEETCQFVLTAPTPNAMIGTASAHEIRITDNDAEIIFLRAGTTVREDGLKAQIELRRRNYTVRQDSVSYQTIAGTADTADFTPIAGTLIFAPGETSKILEIPITSDTDAEPLTETFQLALHSPSADVAIGSPPTHTISIEDDDNIAILNFSSTSTSLPEDGGSAVVTVVRRGSTSESVTVSFATTSTNATSATDYTSVNGTLTFAPGEVQKIITIPILDDQIIEPLESFQVLLSSPGGRARLGTPIVHTVTIVSENPEHPPAGFLFTVTTTADDIANPPLGSLRHAIVSAPTGGTIEFDPSLTGAIVLAGAELVVDKDLTITGPTNTNLVVSGGLLSRIFRIQAGKSVQISGLTLTEGKTANGQDSNQNVPPTAGENGGAILNAGTLQLTDCVISGNRTGDGGRLTGWGVAGSGGGGGGIHNQGGNLSLLRCKVIDNQTGSGGSGALQSGPGGEGGKGGGISSVGGSLSINASTIANNTAGPGGPGHANGGVGGLGGGIYVDGHFGLSQSTISGNVAGMGGSARKHGKGGSGGGIYMGSTGALLRASTISGNQAGASFATDFSTSGEPLGGSGGGIYSTENATIESCTITDNVSGRASNTMMYSLIHDGYGGGIAGNASLRNCIVAHNRLPADSINTAKGPDLFGAFTSFGHNLIGNNAHSTGFAVGANADLVGTTLSPIDPRLAPLANNGGQTSTHALLPGSPAVETGDDALTGTDQRGESRLKGSHVDIGAFEADLNYSIVSFAATESSIAEGSGTANILVKRTLKLENSVTVQFSTNGSTATPGVDFSSVSGSVAFQPGQTEAWISVPIIQDTLIEVSESFVVTITTAGNNPVIGFNGSHVVTILDDEALPSIEFATASSTIPEAGGVSSILVRRTENVGVPVTVNYATANGTAIAGSDYTAKSGTLNFAAGESERTIVIPIINDSLFEADKTFTVQLSAPGGGAILGTTISHSTTIQNDDAPPSIQFELASSTILESAGSILVKAVRTGPSTEPISVTFQTSTGTALANLDFAESSGSLTFASNEAEKFISIPILNDDSIEGIESFTVTLIDPVNSAIGEPAAHTVSILSDDGPTTVAFAVAATSVGEASGDGTVTVTRSGNAGQSFSVSVSIAGGSATAGSDYTSTTQTLSFAAGTMQLTAAIPLIDDQVHEEDETLTLQLTAPTNGAVLGTPSSHVITITDDDDEPPTVENASYRGLLRRSDGNEWGSINLTTTKSRRITGTFHLHGKKLSVRGAIADDGTFTQTFSNRRLSPQLAGVLTANLTSDGATLTGSFTRLSGDEFAFEAVRDALGSKATPVSAAGSYTSHLQSDIEDSHPTGFLRVSIQSSGRITLIGRLPDGTPVTERSALNVHGAFPFHAPCYPNGNGLAGMVDVRDAEPINLTGEQHWFKPATPWQPGIVNAPVTLIGARYTRPTSGRVLDDYDTTNGQAVGRVESYESSDELEIPLNWKTSNAIVPTATTPTKLNLTVRPATGLFRGTLLDSFGIKRRIFGACIQRPGSEQDLAAGHYILELGNRRHSRGIAIEPSDE